MPYLILAAALGIAILMLYFQGPGMTARQVARQLLYILAGVGVLIGIFALFTGRPFWAVAGLIGVLLFALLASPRGSGQPRTGGRSGTGGSDIETRYLRMRLDHGTGQVTGEVLDGVYRGRKVQGLSIDEVLALMRECLREDPPSVKLLEAYLDRIAPEWRNGGHEQSGADPNAGAGSERSSRWGRGAPSPMSLQEAADILGIGADASPEAARAAYHVKMKEHHPDRGGATADAARLNEALEVFLRYR
jgi:hypothetical protein